MDEAYAAMAADDERERDALEWAEDTLIDSAECRGDDDEAG
jgi:hypothetical protein